LNINKYNNKGGNNEKTPQTRYNDDDDDDDDDEEDDDKLTKSGKNKTAVVAKKYNSDNENDGDDEKDDRKFNTETETPIVVADDDDIILPTIKPTQGNKNVRALPKANVQTSKTTQPSKTVVETKPSRPIPKQSNQVNSGTVAPKTQPIAKTTIQPANTLQAKPKPSQKASKFSKSKASNDW